jgi:hypothetical protein
VKSRARPNSHPGFGLVHPALIPLRHKRAIAASFVASHFAYAGNNYMNKCLSVSVPQGPCNSSGLLLSVRAHAGSALRRTAQEVPRLAQARDRTGRVGAGELAPLIRTLLRVLDAAVKSFQALPKGSGRAQLLPGRLDSPLQSVADAGDFGSSAQVTREPVRNRHSGSFRGVWTHTKSGARFERKRLMRMTHQDEF